MRINRVGWYYVFQTFLISCKRREYYLYGYEKQRDRFIFLDERSTVQHKRISHTYLLQ